MSHFSVLVCVDARNPADAVERLDAIMAPWDERMDVPEYRDYIKGSASNYWCVETLRKKGYILADSPADPLDWNVLAAAYNTEYGSDDDKIFVDDEGNAYTRSTYNPESKWDYWRVGGRWGGYFTPVAGCPDDALVSGGESWDGPGGEFGGPALTERRCDGGPKRYLDFEAMRAEKAKAAGERYDAWDDICARTPVALPWSHFRGLVDLGEMGIDDARARYRVQDRIVLARQEKFDSGWGGCVVEEFVCDREEYVALARAAAVPGYALVTLEGQWAAPGKMGWFGMSSDDVGDRAAYHAMANRYLDDLGPDRYVIALDLHI